MTEPIDVEINRLEAICLFSGRVLNRQEKRNEDQFDKMCRHRDRLKRTPFLEIGQLVGVFYKRIFKWCRGKLAGHEELGYKVFLIDYGYYVYIQSNYIISVEELTFPPQFSRFYLSGVVPCTQLTKPIDTYISGLFANATISIKNEIEFKNNVKVADIYVKKKNQEPKDLKTVLLDKGYVKESDNYIAEMRMLVDGLEDFDDLFSQFFDYFKGRPSAELNDSEAVPRNYRTTARRRDNSPDDGLPECVPPLPAGYETKCKAKKGQRDLRSRSEGRTSKPEKRYSYRSTSCRRLKASESSDSSDEATSHPRITAKQVTWVDEELESEMESSDSSPKKRSSINLKYQAEMNQKKSILRESKNQAASEEKKLGFTKNSDLGIERTTETNKPPCSSGKTDCLEVKFKNTDEYKHGVSTNDQFGGRKAKQISLEREISENKQTSPTKGPYPLLNSSNPTESEPKEPQKKIEENKLKSLGSSEVGTIENPVATNQDLDCTKSTAMLNTNNSKISHTSEDLSFDNIQTTYSSDSSFNKSDDFSIPPGNRLKLFRQKLKEDLKKLEHENCRKTEVLTKPLTIHNLEFGKVQCNSSSGSSEVGTTEKPVVVQPDLSFDKSQTTYSSDSSFSKSDEGIPPGNRLKLFRQKLKETHKKLENEMKTEVLNKPLKIRNVGFDNSSELRQMQYNSDTSSLISNEQDSLQNASSLLDSTEDMMKKHIEMQMEFEKTMLPEPKDVKAANLRKSSTYRTVSYIPNPATGVLLHTSDGKVIQPKVNLEDCQLDNHVLRNMEKFNLRELNRVQMHSIPTICAKRNMMIIAGPRTGKTSGYVIPLVSNLLNKDNYKLLTGSSPKCVVISPYAEKGKQVTIMFQDIGSKLNVVHTHGSGAEFEKKDAVLNRCDVLVSTPRCLVRMLVGRYTTFENLCHIVFDDAEILFEKFKPEIEVLLVRAHDVMKRRKTDLGLQLVATSQLWTNPVEHFCHVMKDATICIVNTLEACVYAGIKPIVTLLHRNNKIEKLFALLKEVEGKKRVLVACKSHEEVNYVCRVLMDMGINGLLMAHENLSSVDITGVPHHWNKEDEIKNVNALWKSRACAPILIRSDEVLEEVPITNAQVLIHYDMPVTLKTLGRRFFSLLENYRNILVEDSGSKSCQVHIFMDEEDALPAPSVIKYMTRLGTILPDEILKVLKDLEHKRESEKMNKALCRNLKLFGRCWDQKRCSERHIVSKELDDSDNIPSVGKVKIIVQHIHGACHFSAQLVAHKTNDEWEKIPSKSLELSFKLDIYYRKEYNRRMIGTASIGDIAAYEYEGTFHRVMILELTRRNKRNEPLNAHVRLIDVGIYKYHVPLVHLYSLPQEWRQVPPCVVDVFLCNLQPKDLDIEWSSSLVSWVNQQLEQVRHKSSDGYLIGKIMLRLGGSLWLDPLEYWSNSMFMLNLRQELLSSNRAIVNPDHIPTLRQLCVKAGIEIPEEEVNEIPDQRECRWAWLPTDEVVLVHVVTVEAPDIVFVRLNSLTDNLTNLTNDIQTYMENEQDCSNPVTTLNVGDVCLAKSQDGWNRAMVHRKMSTDQVELFFLDYGDFATVAWSDVRHIPDNFISKLPFQIIECYLAGVRFNQSEDSSWEDEVINIICDLTRNQNEEAINLQVKVCDVEMEGKVSKGRRYQVILSDTNNEEIVIINEKLAALSNFSTFEENNNFQEKFSTFMNLKDETGSNEDEDRESANGIVDLISTMQDQCQVLLPKEFNIHEEVTMNDRERRVLEFIRNIEEGDFEDSRVTNFLERMEKLRSERSLLENEEYKVSEASSKSTCPEEKVIIRELHVNTEHLASDASSTSQTLSRPNAQSSVAVDLKSDPNPSPKIDKLSPRAEEYCEVLNQDFLDLRAQSTPLADSSLSETFHNVRTSSSPLTPLSVDVSRDWFVKSASPSPNSFISSRLKGAVTHFKDMVSPTLYESSVSSFNSPGKLNLMDKVKPFVGCLSRSVIEEESPIDSVLNSGENAPCETCESCDKTNTEDKISTSKSTTVSLIPSEGKKEEASGKTVMKWVVGSVLDSTDEDLSITSDSEQDIKPSTSDQCVDEMRPITRSPSVEWFQDDSFIYIYIKLPDVKKYELKYDVTWIDFRGEHDGLDYHVNLTLFAGHLPQAIKYTPKAFHFEIKLQKLMRGKRFRWPRLLKSTERCFCIRFNQEKGFADMSDSEDEDIKMEALTRLDGNLILTDVESLASDASHSYSDFDD